MCKKFEDTYPTPALDDFELDSELDFDLSETSELELQQKFMGLAEFDKFIELMNNEDLPTDGF